MQHTALFIGIEVPPADVTHLSALGAHHAQRRGAGQDYGGSQLLACRLVKPRYLHCHKTTPTKHVR